MRSLVLFALVFLASACTSQQQATIPAPTLMVLPSNTSSPTIEPTNTETPTPTLTFTPSITPSPTYTATFTPTNTPIATATPECSVSRWWNEVEGIVTEFLDTAEVASQTARMSLSSVQIEMRRIHREFERLDEPPCVAEISRALRNGMDTINDAFGRFAAQNDGVASVYFNLGGEYFYVATLKLDDAGVIVTDYRMRLPWLLFGGDELNEPTATQLAIEDATRDAEIDVTISAITNATATPQVVACDAAQAGYWLDQARSVFQSLTTNSTAQNFQDVYSAVERLQYPECLSLARSYFLEAINEGMLAAMSVTPDVVQMHVDNADIAMQNFTSEFTRIFPQ